MNPYFTLSAIFLLGLRGIEKKISPGPPISHFSPKDRDEGKVKKLSTSLEAATIAMMKPDSIAREAEVFGDDFVEHFGGTRQHEVKLWNEAVTNWEGESSTSVPIGSILIDRSCSREISGARLNAKGFSRAIAYNSEIVTFQPLPKLQLLYTSL